MKQAIAGFHQDDEGHWVAELACGHGQHVRHDPPWQVRPWVISDDGRMSRLGVELDCVRCDEDQASRAGSRRGAPDFLRGAERLPTIDTPRLALRWLEADDVPALFAIFGDSEVCRYWSHPPLRDLAAAGELRRDIQHYFAERSLFQWGLAERATNQVIGTCTLASLSSEHRRAEVGFALARAAWGRGYIAEALPALLAFAFDTLGLHRIEADVDPRNERSLHVLEREGFRREGLLRERYHVSGELQDAVLLGLLRHEWSVRRRR